MKPDLTLPDTWLTGHDDHIVIHHADGTISRIDDHTIQHWNGHIWLRKHAQR